MKRILFSVVFLLSLTLAYSTPTSSFAPKIKSTAERESRPQENKEKVKQALADIQQQQAAQIAKFQEERMPGSTELNNYLLQKYKDDATFKRAYYEEKEQDAIDKRMQVLAWFDDEKKWLKDQNKNLYTDFKKMLNYVDDCFIDLKYPDHPQGTPVTSYEDILKGKTRIFMWEYRHHDPQNVAQFIKVLRAVKQQNPGQRILLALEFLVNNAETSLPIQFAQDPRDPNLHTLSGYEPAVQAAQELGIDTLALDDYIVKGKFPFYYHKIGNAFLFLSFEVRDGKDAKDELVNIFSSPWPVDQRNRQWAEYINETARYYNIVIVWAGAGHYGLKKLLEIKDVEGKQAIDLFFWRDRFKTREPQYFHRKEKRGSDTWLFQF